MQSFIINIPEEKIDFFLELAEMLDFEVLEIEEDEFEIEDEQEEKSGHSKKKPPNPGQSSPETDDPFLDWEAERKNAKKNKY
ncbi:hypothetical protein [Arachidicoccus terrestris]|uniref:hypothetical protein n=1 Tax=Arachidicoccus terrestris TaxID=2875539 RepID=UPI001CC58DBB|nr:hypothetical protein [Arachidicoccus terrestris]UAY56795.1 hypothetical protein K9M52_07335 [Arachidicoccus terrestris]